MTAAFHVVVVAALLVGPGILPARSLVGARPVGLVVAPLLTGLGCSGAAIVSVAARIPFAAALALVFACVWVASLARIRRRGPGGDGPSVGWGQVAFLAGVATVPLLAVRRPPVDWDARAIWLLHADWLRVGGAEAASEMGNPLFNVTHPDYPPLGPATVAGVWTVLERDYEVGQLVVAILGMSATVVTAVAVCTVLSGAATRLATVAAGALVLAAYGLAGASATNGYVDLVSAAALTGAAVWLLFGRRGGDAALGVVCLAAAMMTKNEGMAAGAGVVAVLIAVKGWRRTVALGAGPLALAALWTVTARSVGAESDIATTARITDLLSLDPVVIDRAAPTVVALWQRSKWEIVTAAVLTAVVAGVARRDRDRMVGRGPVALWAVSMFCFTTLVVVYVLSPQEITWYLATSAARTTVAPRLLLLVECVFAVVVLASWLSSEAPAAANRAPTTVGPGRDPGTAGGASLPPGPSRRGHEARPPGDRIM